MGFLANKKILITGLLSDRSIAYGIAQACHREGAELAFTYVSEDLKDRVAKLASHFNSSIVLPCDVASDEQIGDLFVELAQHWPSFDGLVHSIGFAPRDALKGDYLDAVTRENFAIAHDISSYSFAALAKAARPMLNERASLVTMSYLGAERAIPNYNVMGLAKASLEANVRYMACRLAQSRLWQQQVLPTSANCSKELPMLPQPSAMSRKKKSEMSRPSCSLTWPLA
jgi:enoyl-[acyl-carrier protein] reductase I